MVDIYYFPKLRAFLNGIRPRRKARGRSAAQRKQPMRQNSSSFVLEPLEARLLLAADLTSAITSTALIEPITPDDSGAVVAQVTNQGSTASKGKVEVGIYASQDQVFDSSDVLLGTGHTTGKLTAGQSQPVTVNVLFPFTLTPGSYSLLSVADPANKQLESNEANNVGTGPAINFRWMFGNIPGHTSNEPLTITDADGTAVTFSLSGPGYGEVARDNGLWDLQVTGTNSTSTLTISTAGGNGRVTFDDIHVMGPLGAFTAATTDLRGTMAIDGPMTALAIGSVDGGTVAVQSVQTFTVGIPLLAPGHLTNATILVGANLGQDGKLGGTGLDTDTYGPGQIGLWFVVSGSVTNSFVRVGQDPVDGIFGNGNDIIQGGNSSSIASIVVSGDVSAESRFIAGAFPTTALIKGMIVQTATDPRFITDVEGPTLTAALAQDTGSNSTDGLTNDPTITGSVTDPMGIATFLAGFGTTPAFDVRSDLLPDGSFTLTRARLEQIYGAPLTDGTYTLTLRATDTVGNPRQTTVAFTLDTSISTLTLDLDPASDTAPVGDQQTMETIVTLSGQTEALATVLLLETNETTTADASGNFSFSNVSLVLGVNTFTVQATDNAGNQGTATSIFTRLPVDSDGDGTPDSEEGAGPNGGDANNDGIPDSQQANVVSVLNGDGQYLALVGPTGTAFTSVQTLGNPSPSDTPEGITFPLGFVEFQVTGLVGESLTVDLLLPEGVGVNTYWKYDATPDNPTPHWYEFLYDGTTGAEINSNVVTLHFQDGARGDSDLTVNDRIADPSGPAFFNVAPVARPGGPYVADLGTELTLNGTGSSDPNAPVDQIVSYDWLVNNSIALTGATPTLTAAQIDVLGVTNPDTGLPAFIVQLTVTDSFGLTGTSTSLLRIYDNQPVASFTASPNPALPTQTISFDASASSHGRPDRSIVSYDWDFGDGTTATGVTATHAYAVLNGDFTVTLTVTDNNSPAKTASTSQLVRVVGTNVAPGANAGGPYVADLGSELTLDGTHSYDPNAPVDQIVSYDWLVNNTIALTGATPTLTAAQIDALGVSSFIPIRLTVTDSFGLTDIGTSYLTVYDNQPVASFTATPNPSAVGQSITFDATGSSHGRPDRSIVSYEWDLNGIPGTDAIGPVVTYAYPAFGSYTVTLTVTDNNSPAKTATASLVVDVSLGNIPPTANAGGPYVADLGSELILDGTRSTDPNIPAGDHIVSYDWLVNNSIVLSGATPTLTSDQIDALGVGQFIVLLTVTDTFGATNTASTTLMVMQGNQAPSLDLIGNRDVNEEQLLSFIATATDPNLPADSLTFTLENGATGVVPTGADIDPTSGLFTWTPGEDQGPGSYTFDVVVTDNGSPALSDRETISITVNEVNVAPVLDPIGNRTIDELQLLTFTASATDSDLPTNSLTFTLENGLTGLVPSGASIDPITGVFTWTPAEEQGPGTHTFDVVVTDNGTPALSDRETISITVNEVNVAPVLAPIDNQTIDERVLFTFTALATDSDVPTNSLSFSLENGVAGLVPTGASIDPTTGVFTWTPTEAQGPGSYTFDVVVTDNGDPNLSDWETITITVNETITNSFQGLGDLPGGWLYASHSTGDFLNETPGMGISADGSRIAVNAYIFPGEYQDPLNPGPITTGNTPIIWDATAGVLSPFVIPVGYRNPTITAISADGRTVVGTMGLIDGGAAAFVARQDSDLVLLGGDLPVGSRNTGATAVSADGTVVVGYRISTSGQEAFRWTAADGIQGLGDLAGGAFFSKAMGISADGSVIIGESESTEGREAFRWTAAEGMQGLGDLPGSTFYSRPTAISADGVVIVGESQSTLGGVSTLEAFRWTASDGMQGLGDLPGGAFYSTATALSADGSVIVGRSFSDFEEGFRWTAAGGMQGLGYFTDTALPWFSRATDISADGTVIVGLTNGSESGAFRWTVSEGLQRISTPGFGVSGVVGVSADGNVIAGWGNRIAGISYPANLQEAWRWSTTDGFTRINDQPNVGNYSQVGYVSSDGMVVAGTSSSTSGTEAFRWSQTEGMQSLGDLAGGHWYNFSVSTGISGDGSTIIGYSESTDGIQAFRWTAAGGMQGLGDLPGGTFYSTATDVSADGAVVVGYSMTNSGEEAFRWTAAGGMQGLGVLPGGSQSRAVAASADGSVIIGYGSSTSGTQAFRWTAIDGMEGLGDLPGGIFLSQPTGVSADGSVIVGYSYSTVVYPEAFRWTASGGMQSLGDLPGGDFHSKATGVSADGSVVMGYGFSASGQEAFRWTVAGGMQGLGDLSGGAYYSNPSSMSADGNVIVGTSVTASGCEAFYWSTSTGMVRLQDLLGENFGLAPQLSGWTLQPTFLTISGDGKTLIGNGYDPDKWREGWVAFLDGEVI